MKDKVEAILFAAGRYLEAEYIAKLLQSDLRSTKKALSELQEDYSKREESAITLVRENDQWKLQVKDAYLEYASKLAGEVEIAKTVLETLAVVAWKNGISQAELIKIRGPAAYEHIGDLVTRGFITKTPEGRSFKLMLQQKFFDYFDVEGREDMKALFAPIEADKAAAQAEIDARQAAYDEQVRAAQDAVSGSSAGVSAPPTTSAPSAQNSSAPDLISEAKAAADALEQTTEEEVAAAKDSVEQFGASLAELKREVEEELAEDATDEDAAAKKAHHAHPKHHETHHKHPAHGHGQHHKH